MDREEMRRLKAEFGNIPLERRVVIYARYSTNCQKPESLEHQRERCNEFVAREGLAVVKIYEDAARSGTQTATRDSYNQMLQDSALGLFSKVIVFMFDRFSRNTRDFLNAEYLLNQRGVELLSATEPNIPGPYGRQMKIMYVAYAEAFVNTLVEHTEAGLYLNAAQGRYNGGKVPLGYRVVECGTGKKLVIDPAGAETILFIFEQYAQGKSYADLVELLEQRGARTQKGEHFVVGSFNSLLKNRIYIGEYSYGKGTAKEVIMQMPELRIVSDETFTKVQQRMSENKALAGRKNSGTSYILSGVLKCRKCGANMYISSSNKRKNGKVYPYSGYTCSTNKRRRNQNRCTLKGGVRRDYLERVVIDQIIRRLFGAASLHDVTDRLNKYILSQAKESDRELKRMSKELKKSKADLSRLKNLKADRKEGLDWSDHVKAVTKNISGIETAISELTLKRDSMKCTPDDVIGLIMLLWNEEIMTSGLPEYHEFLKAYLAKLTADDDYIRFKFNLNEVVDDEENGVAAD